MLEGSVTGDHLEQRAASEKFTLVDYTGRGPDGNANIAIHDDEEETPRGT